MTQSQVLVTSNVAKEDRYKLGKSGVIQDIMKQMQKNDKILIQESETPDGTLYVCDFLILTGPDCEKLTKLLKKHKIKL